jgi:hypothetical protein
MEIMKMHTARNKTSVRIGIRNSRHMDVPAFQFLSSLVFPGVREICSHRKRNKTDERRRKTVDVLRVKWKYDDDGDDDDGNAPGE